MNEERDITEALGIEESNKANNPQAQNAEGEKNKYSNGLRSTATVLTVIAWIAFFAAIIAGIVYLANAGDTDSYDDYKRLNALTTTAIAAGWFEGLIASTFSTYVL